MNDERDDGVRSSEPIRNPPWRPRAVPSTGEDPWRSRPRHSGAPEPADELMVRPFLLTGGRSRPARSDLRVESLIESQRQASPGSLRFEGRQIFDLCRRASSVAEISATLGVPLGVARILVSDLIDEGYLSLVQSQTLSVQMLERIRDRVRAL